MKLESRKERASSTLEAIIIFPTILIIIFAVIFAFELMYQYVILEFAASYGATRGAMMWQYNIESTGFPDDGTGEKAGLYHDIDELLSGGMSEERKNAIITETDKIIKSLALFNGAIEIEPSYKGALTGRTVTVSVSQRVAIPFDAILEYFDEDVNELTAKSSANLYDPDEFIRNLDYGYEVSSTIINQIGQQFEKIKGNRKND